MTIHFLLTPDKSSSLALKRLVAQQDARMDVIIGTWPELLTFAKSCHLLPGDNADWKTQLTTAMKKQKSAFWSESLLKVPAEEQSIVDIIDSHLTKLLEAVGINGKLESLLQDKFSERLIKRLGDFAKLHADMEQLLPPHLNAIRNMVNATPDRILRTIRVYHLDQLPRLNPWQQSLITAINSRAGAAADSSFAALLEDIVATPGAVPGSTLQHIQRSLFSPDSTKTTNDKTTVQWLGCRDYLQEAEITAGMIQKAMADDSSLKFNDFALLLPSDNRYRQAVSDAFSLAGIPLSGLGQEITGRDLGREVIYYFLLCKQGLAPSMAMATLLTSPLMPWTLEEGHLLAQKVINGNYELKTPVNAEMLALIKNNISTTAELAKTLDEFLDKLRSPFKPEDVLYTSRKNAEETVKNIKDKTKGSGLSLVDAVWKDLLSVCQPQPVNIDSKSKNDLTREGLAVFHEGEEPWRRVRQLFVLGCSEGHYPTQAVRSPVFFDNDLTLLNSECSLGLETSEARGKRLRDVFRRQLCASSDSAVFLIRRRDGMGKSLAPSPSLAFMAALLDGVKEDEKLIIDLDSEAGRNAVRGLAIAEEQDVAPVWKPVAEDLELGNDLVALRSKPESPSRLETLMVSPLAWLFERLEISPREWKPEQLDVSTKGTLAHKVFENLFAPGVSLPTAQEVVSRVAGLLQEAIKKECPFLSRDEWKVEREHLAQDIIKAAQRWSEVINTLGATVIATEVSLKGILKLGVLDDLPIHGNADLLLELPGNRLFVIDYKKSSSKDRRTRMQAGYDHQATLYRVMIKTGGLEYPDKEKQELADALARFRDSGEICALYYLMNDQSVLTDSSGWLGGGFYGRPEMGAGISCEALPLIEKRIGQVRRGKIELNSEKDGDFFKDKCGISAVKYALESSPLVRMFIKNPTTV